MCHWRKGQDLGEEARGCGLRSRAGKAGGTYSLLHTPGQKGKRREIKECGREGTAKVGIVLEIATADVKGVDFRQPWR